MKDAEPMPAFIGRLDSVALGWTDEDGEEVKGAVFVRLEGEVASPTTKKPSKVDEARRKFERAWAHGGMEMRGEKPYVSRSALKAWLVENAGVSERTARNAVNPSRDDGIVAKLTSAGCIEAYEHGWIVGDDLMMLAAMVEKLKG